jgi:hypothetical protein
MEICLPDSHIWLSWASGQSLVSSPEAPVSLQEGIPQNDTNFLEMFARFLIVLILDIMQVHDYKALYYVHSCSGTFLRPAPV